MDRPQAGELHGDLIIAGWVVAEDGPVERVIAMAGGGRLAHVQADRDRPDVGTAFPDVDHAARSGFRIRLPQPVAQRAQEIVIGAQLAHDPWIPFWRIRLASAAAVDGRERRSRRKRRPWWRRRAEGDHDEVRVRTSANDQLRPVVEDFRVIALISTFNEADIVEPVLDHLASNGVFAYLVDNGSTDETVARASRWLGPGLLGFERLPPPAEGGTSWQAILARKLELARELGADWYIHHDADEIRESLWPGTTLREAVGWVDRLGYNAIDFRVLNFPPVDDSFRPGDDPRRHFMRWEEPAEYDRIQRKCWKAGAYDVSLDDGGHDVCFAGRLCFPCGSSCATTPSVVRPTASAR